MNATATTTATALTPVHLTRRGRVVLMLALVAVLFGAFSLGRADSQAAPTAGAEPAQALQQVTVAPGESLWAVAERIAPHADPRDVMEQITELNSLDSSQLQVGQHLLLPVAA